MVSHMYYEDDSLWSCNCAFIQNNSVSLEFTTVNSKLRETTVTAGGKLLTYSGRQVGTYSAYNEKIAASDYPAMNVPEGAYIFKKGTNCIYLNDTGRIEDDIVVRDGNNASKDVNHEYITAGNLHFFVKRNYTSIDKDMCYVVRAVNEIGEEGQPSEISDFVTCRPDEAAIISFTPSDKADIENIVKYRIYRSSSGTTGSDFLFVDEVSADNKNQNGEIEFKDTKDEEELNEVMPKFGEVPEDLEGICGMSGGFIAAFKGKDIYFSEPYLPYCWSWEFSQSVPFDIVGMAVRSNYLYVMTTGSLYAFVGDHPELIMPLAMRFDVPCISKKSIAHVDGNIIYAGTTGLVIINNQGPAIFSDKLYTIEQYKELHFENCICAGEYDGKYIVVFEDKAMVFDFSDGQLNHTIMDNSAFDATSYSWNDGSWQNYRNNFSESNTPYGETMITQTFSENYLKSKWKSKEYVFARPIAFTCARVNFDNENAVVHIKIYGDGNLVYDSSLPQNAPDGIPCGKAFRLPVMRRETHWSVEVSGNTDITSIELAESMAEL